jgi:hypothetical protein
MKQSGENAPAQKFGCRFVCEVRSVSLAKPSRTLSILRMVVRSLLNSGIDSG